MTQLPCRRATRTWPPLSLLLGALLVVAPVSDGSLFAQSGGSNGGTSGGTTVPKSQEPRPDRKSTPMPPVDGAERSDGASRSGKDRGARGAPAAKKKPLVPETPEEREKALGNLYAHLATAADSTEAGAVSSAIEVMWVQSGSDTVSLLLQRATTAMSEKDNPLARQLFDAVVELAPDFAEGFARRAYFLYTEDDSLGALGDLRRVLALEPNHYRALDGIATILYNLGEKRAALKALQQLEQVHPHWPGLEDSLKSMAAEVEGQGI